MELGCSGADRVMGCKPEQWGTAGRSRRAQEFGTKQPCFWEVAPLPTVGSEKLEKILGVLGLEDSTVSRAFA